MKILKKMLLIKWYYIEHELIEFDTLNFMTGKNASGKSTIIDALQIVMLGDTRGNFFNKAANEKGGRTLDGYLKGEISDDGDVGYKSKRSGRFTSYIALEFRDTVERKNITCGIVFDSYKDAPTDHMFFILDDSIPENHFIDEETNTAMDYRKLKTYFARNYSASKFKTYKESNKSYQNDFLAKMGAIKPKFFSLFKKSVTFTPINDIEKFISDYVCDVTNEIDVEKMKENIRQYKELEKRAKEMQERLVDLRKIEEIFNSYQNDVTEEYMQKFILEKSKLQIEIDKLIGLKNEYDSNLKQIEQLREEGERLNLEEEKLTEIMNKKFEEKSSSDINQKQKNLEKNISDLKIKLDEIERKTKSLIINFRNKVAKWRINLKQILEDKNRIEDIQVISKIRNLQDNIEYLLGINEENIEETKEDVLQEIKNQMDEINSFANKTYYQKEQEEKGLAEKSKLLQNEIVQLKTGNKPYKKSLIEFKEILKQRLEEKFKEEVDVQILADLLEIKNIVWKNAIECYINHQMFYYIIEPKYYEEASRIYREIARENKYYGFGIVDIENIQRLHIQIEKDSLAEEIDTTNNMAKSYINYLLGKVIKCEKVEDLRKFKTAITSDCMLYKNYVLRKIFDKNNEFKFIGKKSIDEQIELKEKEVEQIRQKLDEIIQIKNISNEIKNADTFNQEEIKYILEDINTIKQKSQIKEQKEKYEKELSELDLTWLNKIENEIKKLDDDIKKIRDRKTEKSNNVTEKQTKNSLIKTEKIPEHENEIEKIKRGIEYQFEEEWIQQFGNKRFEEETQSSSLEVLQKRANTNIYRLAEKKEKKSENLINVRTEYVKKYNFSYNVSDKNSNKEFSEELKKLEDIELPNYIEKIKDSKEKSYQQFREDFISKLKANIDEVENQIEELNSALKNSRFGVDEYYFKVKPKQEYKRFYDMIKDEMLMEGYNLWSEAFNTKYSEVINELFNKLTSSDIHDEEYNKNISIYTDYKTYLSFDLVVTNKQGDVQHLSRTLDKKSGGETQTPFYISILASFAQLYRINKNRNDNTLRLIVFDEAFNKMDEERIKESLKLLQKFGFQGIIAAPSEKAGEIIPLVPNTFCVIRKDKNTVVKQWSKDRDIIE